MGKNWIKYGVLIFVGVLAVVFMCAFNSKLIQELAAIPLIASLLGVIVTLVRDDAAHHRSLLVADHQNRFVLGISSHIANIAFDKHVAFCEEYVEVADRVLGEIFSTGPPSDALDQAADLHKVRRKHTVWLTDEIDMKLEKFESAIRMMGASANYVEVTSNADEAGQRSEKINQMYRIFSILIDLKEWDGEPLTNELAVTSQIKYLREVLGTEDLSAMRQLLVSVAGKELGLKNNVSCTKI